MGDAYQPDAPAGLAEQAYGLTHMLAGDSSMPADWAAKIRQMLATLP